MEEKVLNFGESYINKDTFYKKRKPISTDKAEIKRIVLSEKYSYGKKSSFTYFTGYRNETDPFPAPLCIKLTQTNGCVKYFDNNNKHINLLVCYEELLKNTIKYGIKLKIYLKGSLIVNQCIMINTLIEYIQIFSIMKYLKIMNIVLAYP